MPNSGIGGGTVDLTSYQKKNDEFLNTDEKTITGGINEVNNKNKLFCSEIVAMILQFFLEARVLGLQPNTLSPKDLARLYGLKD